ncbi:MAG: ATP-binding protein [Tannerella sp.]|jgi:predicted ATP-dependent endonuclease of OLD family|nr:ATP-binding protein [Tannerella sp.]
MEKWIKHISGTIPYTHKTVDIDLDGKNLIVTGANGSGKTSFVKSAYNQILNNRNRHIELSPQEIFPDFESPVMVAGEFIIRFFEEKRLSAIKQPVVGQGIMIEYKLGNSLEQHLLNLKTRASFAITEGNNEKLSVDIQNWFDHFEKNLKILFEDENLTLKLNLEAENPHFLIIQKGKPPFTFQTLSAGYRAIFDIYADLLMITEHFKIMPDKLSGVVFIDEIDSHLHVSLQRLIFPFFTQSFPKIQFIVTTHSPFVLMSTPDTVVYDLAKNEPITEDLSYYTYSAVMKGLWNVKPISIHLENSVKEIAQIVNSNEKDYKRLRELVENTKPYEDALDSESKVFLLLGMETLLEEEYKNV